MVEYDLDRFLVAQAPVMERVKAELRSGHKNGHWMWFVFPQLRGLGFSELASKFGIKSLDEAEAYLEHPILGARLKECVQLVTQHKQRTAEQIFGSVDAMKFRSCLTLFGEASDDGSPFQPALDQFYEGLKDPKTIELLKTRK